MIDKRLLEEILGIAVSTGADFAEVYSERTRNGSIRLLDSAIESIGDNVVSGVGRHTPYILHTYSIHTPYILHTYSIHTPYMSNCTHL